MSFDFDNTNIKKNVFKGFFGIEKESLRVDERGYLSHTRHPFVNNPNIDRDFCENQVEIVTDVCDSIQSVYNRLTELHNTVIKTLDRLETGRELLWPFSSPPYIKGENDIPIANFGGILKGKEIYRKYLAEKYGKKKMLFSGIHFNFSFDDNLLAIGFQKSDQDSFRKYKDNIYLELAKKLTKYSWLIVFLTAASPIMDSSFFCEGSIGNDIITPYSSARCSEIGYWNKFIPVFKYDNIESYTDSIRRYVDNGLLKSFSELYYPIRLKPRGENSLENLRQTGVNHIELRMLDLNPLSPVGIKIEDINFIHFLIIYLMSFDAGDFLDSEQIKAITNTKCAAKYDINTLIDFGGKKLTVKDSALTVLKNMENFFLKLGQADAVKCIKYQMTKITDKNKRYAETIRNDFGKNYVINGLELSMAYADKYCREVALNV